MPGRITLEHVLDKQSELLTLAKQCNVQELYYINPEENMPMRYMGKVHFLVIPIKGKMSNDDLYDFKTSILEILNCTTAFVATEDHLKDLFERKVLSDEEYQLCIKKSQDILNVSVPNQLPPKSMTTEQQHYKSQINTNYNPSLFLTDRQKSINIATLNKPTNDLNYKHISGELLESFNELISCELEDLLEIDDEQTKKMLVDILFDSQYQVEVVVNYARDIDPGFGPRFGILYSSLNPDRWDDPAMEPYKNALIDSYIKRSTDNSQLCETIYQEKTLFLKANASQVIKDFFRVKNIHRPVLNEVEQREKLERLNKIQSIITSNDKTIVKDAEKLTDELDELQSLLSATSLENTLTKQMVNSRNKILESNISFKIAPNSWKKLSLTNPDWNLIYNEIKYTPKNKERTDQIKLIDIVRALLYKVEKHCRWKEIPQNLPPASTVRHYYYEWKNKEILPKILSHFAEENKENILNANFISLKI